MSSKHAALDLSLMIITSLSPSTGRSRSLASPRSVGPQLPWRAEGSVVAAAIGGKIYGCGGLWDPIVGRQWRRGDGTNPTDCHRYDPDTNRWDAELAPM